MLSDGEVVIHTKTLSFITLGDPLSFYMLYRSIER